MSHPSDIKLTVLGQQVLEKVQIAVLLCLLGHGDEEANQEQDDDESNESDCVLERSPQSASEGLSALIGGDLVVFFIPEIGEGDNEQAEQRVQAVQSVVDNLELKQDIVDGIGCGPVLLPSQAASGCRRDQSDIDRHEQDGSQEREDGEDANNRDCSRSLTWCLIDIHEDGSDEQEDGNCYCICHPDEGCLDERHVARVYSPRVSRVLLVWDRGRSSLELEVGELEGKPSLKLVNSMSVQVKLLKHATVAICSLFENYRLDSRSAFFR